MSEGKKPPTVASIQFIASAGTGKTHQVTSLYTALILGRPYPDEPLGEMGVGEVFDGSTRLPCEEILMLTFARNAASEMRSRITAEIERQLDRDPDRADIYWSLLRRISGAVISTIHAFGQRLIAQNALALGIAPSFQVMEEDEADRLLREAMAGELRRSLSAGTSQETAALEELCLARKTGNLVAATGEFLRRCESLGLELSLLDPEELALRPPPPTVAGLRGVEEYLYSVTAQEKPNAVADSFLDELQDRIARCGPASAPEEVAAAAAELRAGVGGSWGREGMPAIRKEVISRLEVLAGWPLQQRARNYLIAFLGYAGRCLRAYEEAKKERGVIDFNDLLLRARDLVRRRPEILPRLAVVIIDEAQDNSRAQNELVEAIRAETGAALVLCGDTKQTIHTWRGADPAGMAALARRLQLEPVPLQVSYRSRKSLLDWVNDIFREVVLGPEKYGPEAHLTPCSWAPVGPEPAVELLLPEWEAVPLRVEVPKKKQTEEKAGLELTVADLAAIVESGEAAGGIPAPRWAGWLEQSATRISREARAVADRISLLCRPDGDPAFRPREIFDSETRWENDRTFYRYRDITILLRATSRQDLYEAALRERGIPYTGVGKGRGFYFRQEVRDLSSLLRMLAFPRDDLARLAVLRSPFFSLSDRAIGLLPGGEGGRERVRWLRRSFSGASGPPEDYLAALRAAGLEEDASAALRADRVLRRLRALAGRWNGTDLLRRAIDLTGYDAVLAGSFNGLQKLANLRLLLSQLSDRERKDRLDLAGLARFLDSEIRSGTTAPDAAVLDPSNDAVVISTIHAAKGLSSPVVFIPDLRRLPASGGLWLRLAEATPGLPSASGYFRVIGEDEGELELETADWGAAKAADREEEREEERRLFYVAATRGRDLVVLSGENAGRRGSWREWINQYHLCNPAPPKLVRVITYPDLRKAAPPPAGESLEEPPSAGRLAALPDSPVPAPLPESYRVAATVLSGVPEEGEGEEEWERRRGEYARTGLINLPPVYLMSRGSGEGGEEPAEGDLAEPSGRLGRRIGAGTFGHAVLEQLDFSRPLDGQVREAASGYGGGEVEAAAFGKQLESAAAAVAGLLKGVAPEQVIRELPFAARFDSDGAEVIVDGAIDLMFFRDGVWRIVDYKFSGRPAAELKKKYGLQLAIYREAVSRPIPGRREREPLFREGTVPAPFSLTILGIGPDGTVREVEVEEEAAGNIPARVVAAARLIRDEAAPRDPD